MNNNKNNIFDFFNYRTLAFYDKIKMIRQGKMPAPQLIGLHLTSGCNHDCVGCDYRVKNKVHKILTPQQNDHIINELISNSVGALEFAGGGEPLLDPYLPELLYKIKKRRGDIGISFLTNGSLMNGKVLEAMIDCGSFIRVSLESGSNPVFQKVKNLKNPNEFPKIINNIKEAMRLKKEKGKTLNINIKFTVGKNNYKNIENGIKLAADLGVDSIQFKLYENAPGVQLSPGERAAISVKLHQLKKEYHKDVKILGDLKKSSIYHHCWLNPLYALVDLYGDVYVCMYFHHRVDDHKLGNLFEQSFKDIWFSQRHWDIIKNIDNKKCNVYDCRFHYYNALWDKIIKNEDDLKFV